MIIFEVKATFGKLENSTLSLSKGLNIIEGSNETGKSTWCKFIHSMLYGIDTTERDSKGYIAVKNRYRPWSGLPMGGTMKVYTEDYGEMLLERRTINPSAPMRDFHAYGPLGEEMSLTYTDVGQQLLGIDASCFERSAFIETPHLPSGGTGELERRILALVSSGEEKSSYSDTRSMLENWQRKLDYRGRGKIPELEQRIKVLESDLKTCLKHSAELDSIQQRISSLESEREALLSSIAEKQAEFSSTVRDRIKAAEKRYEEAKQAALEAHRALPAGDPKPTSEELRMLERRFYLERESVRSAQTQLALLREKQRRLDECRLQLFECNPFGGCSVEKAKEIVSKDINQLSTLTVGNISLGILKKYSPFMLMPAAISVFMLLLLPDALKNTFFWLFTSLVLFISSSSLLFISRAKARKEIDAISKAVLQKYGAKDQGDILQSLNSYIAAFNECLALKEGIASESASLANLDTVTYSEDIIARILNIFPLFKDEIDIESGLTKAVQSAVESIEYYNRKAFEMKNTEELLNTFKNNWINSESSPQYSFVPDDIKADLERNENELAALYRQRALLEGSMSNTKDSTELEYEIKQLQKRVEQLQKKYSAITLAIDTLSDAHKLLRERFSPRLNEETAEIFSFLTSNKYNRVIINKEFEAMAGGNTSDGIRRSLELSSGTADQLYLALRLAICRTVLPQNKRVPIILDDALLTFDDKRMASALEYLYQESKERQILLFTCHRREGAYLKGKPGVSILSLY